MKRTLLGFSVLSLLASQAKAQPVLFDFETAPTLQPLPYDLTEGQITAYLSASSPLRNYSFQQCRNRIASLPAEFQGNCLYPSATLPSDVIVGFSQPLQQASIMYSPSEEGCGTSATMRITGDMDGVFVATNTATAPNPGTWPLGVLTLNSPQGFNRVVIHYEAAPVCGNAAQLFVADNLTVTLLAPTPEPITWERFIGTEPVANTLQRPTGGGWNAGAVSNRVLASGDGYAEYTIPQTPGYAMFGLSNGDTDGRYADIDYALYPYPPTGQLLVYEKGVYIGMFGPYLPGDVLRVGVEGGVVTYRSNGQVLTTSADPQPITYPLLVDTSLYSAGTQLLDAQIAGMAGQLQDRALVATNVSWRNLALTTAPGSTLTREASTGWNGGASSAQELVSGDGYAEYQVSDMASYVMFGLSHGDTDQAYADVDYAIYTYPPTQKVMVYEGGVYRTTLGGYGLNDILRVWVEGGVVTYSVNGTILYSSSTPPTYPLVTDTSLYSPLATVSGAKMGGALQPVVEASLAWANLVNVTDSAGTLQRPTGAGWNAGAISTQTLAGDGYVEYSVSSPSDYVMFGLGNGDTDQGYSDIDYAIYTYPGTGRLFVYEGGVFRAAGGTYAVGDKLRVAVERGVVKYRKNGVLVYSSTVPPTYPLNVDTSLYSTGATVSGAKIRIEQ